jgi:hypothetical protein
MKIKKEKVSGKLCLFTCENWERLKKRRAGKNILFEMQSTEKQAISAVALQKLGKYLLLFYFFLHKLKYYNIAKASAVIDADIRGIHAAGTKKSYEWYKAMYLKTEPEVHSEESVLAFLVQCKEELNYVPSILWTVRSLITTFLCEEVKVEITDMHTTVWLKKLNDII